LAFFLTVQVFLAGVLSTRLVVGSVASTENVLPVIGTVRVLVYSRQVAELSVSGSSPV
jgi:hypothetical protein